MGHGKVQVQRGLCLHAARMVLVMDLKAEPQADLNEVRAMPKKKAYLTAPWLIGNDSALAVAFDAFSRGTSCRSLCLAARRYLVKVRYEVKRKSLSSAIGQGWW